MSIFSLIVEILTQIQYIVHKQKFFNTLLEKPSKSSLQFDMLFALQTKIKTAILLPSCRSSLDPQDGKQGP